MRVPPVLLLDACVLYPAGLRNVLMWLAVHDLIRPKWSEQIHHEWMRNVLEDRPDLAWEQVERIRRLMDQHAGDCLVTAYERHIDTLVLPDQNDRHVLAAAIESGADAVVTWNLRDFPESILSEYGVGVLTPDQVVSSLIDQDRRAVIGALAEHRASLKNPPKSPDEFLENLERQGLSRTVELLRNFASSL